jgi:hypothetical protein
MAAASRRANETLDRIETHAKSTRRAAQAAAVFAGCAFVPTAAATMLDLATKIAALF